MLEYQRLAYLKELGAMSYWARSPLPGAADSPELIEDSEPQEYTEIEASTVNEAVSGSQESHSVPVPSADTDQIVVSSTKEITQNIEQDIAPDLEPEVVVNPIKPDVQTTIEPFTLRYWVSEQVIFVEGYESNIFQGAEVLVFNLANALGTPLLPHQPDAFQWPLGNIHSRRQMDFNHASQAAKASLMANIQLSKATHIVLLGAVSCRMLLAQSETAEYLGQSPANHSFPAAVWCTHSLNDLLVSPELKRETWLHLQPIKKK